MSSVNPNLNIQNTNFTPADEAGKVKEVKITVEHNGRKYTFEKTFSDPKTEKVAKELLINQIKDQGLLEKAEKVLRPGGKTSMFTITSPSGSLTKYRKNDQGQLVKGKTHENFEQMVTDKRAKYQGFKDSPQEFTKWLGDKNAKLSSEQKPQLSEAEGKTHVDQKLALFGGAQQASSTSLRAISTVAQQTTQGTRRAPSQSPAASPERKALEQQEKRLQEASAFLEEQRSKLDPSKADTEEKMIKINDAENEVQANLAAVREKLSQLETPSEPLPANEPAAQRSTRPSVPDLPLPQQPNIAQLQGRLDRVLQEHDKQIEVVRQNPDNAEEQQKLEKLTSELESLTRQIDRQADKISRINTELQEAERQLDGVQGSEPIDANQVSKLSSRISELRQQARELQGQSSVEEVAIPAGDEVPLQPLLAARLDEAEKRLAEANNAREGLQDPSDERIVQLTDAVIKAEDEVEILRKYQDLSTAEDVREKIGELQASGGAESEVAILKELLGDTGEVAAPTLHELLPGLDINEKRLAERSRSEVIVALKQLVDLKKATGESEKANIDQAIKIVEKILTEKYLQLEEKKASAYGERMGEVANIISALKKDNVDSELVRILSGVKMKLEYGVNLAELRETEGTFNENLEHLVSLLGANGNAFVKRGIISKEDFEFFNREIAGIKEFSDALLKELSKDPVDISAVNQRFEGAAEIFKNIDRIQGLGEKMQGKINQDSILSSVISSFTRGQGLTFYAIQPVQRVPRYLMLVNQLARFAAEDKSTTIEELKGNIQAITTSMNEAARITTARENPAGILQELQRVNEAIKQFKPEDLQGENGEKNLRELAQHLESLFNVIKNMRFIEDEKVKKQIMKELGNTNREIITDDNIAKGCDQLKTAASGLGSSSERAEMAKYDKKKAMLLGSDEKPGLLARLNELDEGQKQSRGGMFSRNRGRTR